MLSFLKNTFASGIFKRLFKNTSLLVMGDTVSAVFAALTFAVSARVLGTQVLGVLVLIDAYVHIVDNLVNFQSWQFMIKYGSDALGNKDVHGFKALVKFGTLVDSFTALFGCAVCIALAGIVGRWMGWTPEIVRFTVIYSMIIAFHISGIPTGILRIFDKFKLFSIQKSICASIKLVGVFFAWRFGYGLRGFLWVWMLTEVADYVSLTVMAWIELRKRGYGDIWSEPLKGITKRYPGVWKFLISTNLTGSVKVGFREFDILVVGKLLGLTDVSLYKLAKKLCGLLDRLTNALYQALYPELAAFWAKRDYANFRHMIKRMIYIMGGLSLFTWLVFLFGGHWIIQVIFGKDFTGAYWVTLWYWLANGIAITTLPLAPMLLAMGEAHLSFWIQFLPTLIYFPVLFWMLQAWGLSGAGYAYIVYHALRVVLQYGFAKHLWKKTPQNTPPSQDLTTAEEDGA